MSWGLYLGQYFASKAVVDKIELPEKYYKAINSKLDELEGWTKLFRNFELDMPHTWVTTGLNIMRKISVPETEPPKKSIIHRYTEQVGVVRLDNLNAIQFYSEIISLYEKESFLVVAADSGELRGIKLKGIDEVFYYYTQDNKENDSEETTAIPFVPRDILSERRKIFDKALSDLYWSHHSMLKVSVNSSSDVLEYVEIPPVTREYEGVLTSLYESLPKYKERGIRRSLLLQGPPGTGKSTLALNVAQRMSKRTLVLTHSYLTWVTEFQWTFMLNMFQPDMLIVDDIDRCSNDMNRRLFLFEDQLCNVPLILLTSNDYHQLPDAFKRPGRIDQILEVQTPSDAVRHEVIRSIARQEDVEVPADRLAILDEIHEEFTGAYIVELFRRVKAQGWDYQIPEYDMTFKGLRKEVRDRWNGQKDELNPNSLTMDDLICAELGEE